METDLVTSVQDTEELSPVLTQVLFFCEHLNAVYAKRIHAWQSTSSSSQPLQFRNLIGKVQSSLLRSNEKWRKTSELLSLALDAEINPPIQEAVIKAVAKHLMDVRRPSKSKGSSSPNPIAPESLEERLWLYALQEQEGFSFSTREVSIQHGTSIRLSKSLYRWELVDSIGVVQDFLTSNLNIRETVTTHYIQRWLRVQFGIPYNTPFKYVLAAIVRRFNELFYGTSVPSLQHRHTTRTSTVGTALLIDEIYHILNQPKFWNEKNQSELEIERKDLLRVSLGLYFFFRLCNLLRGRYHWTEQEELNEIRHKPSQNLGSEASEQTLQLVKKSTHERHCISALRPLEYTYFQAKVFGAMSGITGLTSVFRGGLLPRPDKGRTFIIEGPYGSGKTILALQMMADMAYRGRIALYVSFEESYSAIVDRLVTFGFVDNDKYEICEASSGLGKIVKRSLDRQPPKGLLILYGHGQDEKDQDEKDQDEKGFTTLDGLIETIGNAADEMKDPRARRRGRWRALTVDSINALVFNTDSSVQGDEHRHSHRKNLVSLMKTIERNKFWGLIINEEGDEEFSKLPYLADTVIDLGFTEDRRRRWLEVKKCRTQNYHPGQHPFRIAEGQGILIFPSLSSRRSTLRRQGRGTLSKERIIPFPKILRDPLKLSSIAEKSSTLIWGENGTKKTFLTLYVATEDSRRVYIPPKDRAGRESTEPKNLPSDSYILEHSDEFPSLGSPKNVLVITFHTPEVLFAQMLRENEAIGRRWDRLQSNRIRWFSPGINLTADELISEIWDYINKSRRQGIPVERVVFAETDMAEETIPAIQDTPLFWPTLIELVTTETPASFFIVNTPKESDLVKLLRNSVDYSFYIKKEEVPLNLAVEIEKRPGLIGSGDRRTARVHITREGEFKEAQPSTITDPKERLEI